MSEIMINIDKHKVKVRPYTLRHLLQVVLARQSKDSEKIKLAYNEIINYCVLSDHKFNSHEYKLLIVKLILISEFQYKPEKDFVCENCQHEFKVEIDQNKIGIDFNGPKELELYKFQKFSIQFKWPDLWADDNKNLMVIQCIDKIIAGDESLEIEDLSNNELDDLLNAITPEHLEKIKKMLLNPVPATVVQCKCPKCDHNHTKVISGFKEFINLL